MKSFNDYITEAVRWTIPKLKSKFRNEIKKWDKSGQQEPDPDSKLWYALADYLYDEGITKTDDPDRLADAMEELLDELT